MSVKMTEEGKANLQKRLEGLYEDLKSLRDEKNIAYTLTGDTWHDNPYWNQLERDERLLEAKIREVKDVLENAEIISVADRNMKNVALGSIVKCRCTYLDFDDEDIDVFEIVGEMESDIDDGKLNIESVVAQNLLGLGVGDKVSFTTPGGPVCYEVLAFYASRDDIDPS